MKGFAVKLSLIIKYKISQIAEYYDFLETI